jgi:hypothetical protein
MNPPKPLASEQPKFIQKMLDRARQRKEVGSKEGGGDEQGRKEVIITKGYREHLQRPKPPPSAS